MMYLILLFFSGPNQGQARKPAWTKRPKKMSFLNQAKHPLFCSGLFCKPTLCFVLSCGIRVASKSNVDSIPFLIGVLILRCKYQSFMIIEIVMSILFNRCCFFSSGSDLFNIRKIQSQLSQRCSFHPSQVAFVFPALPPLFSLRTWNS